MLDFNDFFYFVQVVDRGGFTAAGRTLRIVRCTAAVATMKFAMRDIAEIW